MNRREFVISAGAAAAACACACCGMGSALAEEAQGAPPEEIVDVGAFSDFSADKVSDTLAKSHKLLVIRSGQRLYATTSVCTHKNCVLKLKEGGLACPCHGSRFSPAGEPTKGPARRPLVRYGISVNDKGRILVDRSKQFNQEQWESAGSFVVINEPRP